VPVFSSADQLNEISSVLIKYARLPFFVGKIPGAIMEAVLASVRGGEVLQTYDFVDVIKREERVGWQVKSTMHSTPVTWKRAKIPDSDALVEASRRGPTEIQALGDAIINFCNDHALESLRLYDLNEIGYARLILRPDNRVTYFEKSLCTRADPRVFIPEEYEWRWSTPKVTVKKEQLQALHGYHRETNTKCWAWHGLGENQLHFSGEGRWWPADRDHNSVTFTLPNEDMQISLVELVRLLDGLNTAV